MSSIDCDVLDLGWRCDHLESQVSALELQTQELDQRCGRLEEQLRERDVQLDAVLKRLEALEVEMPAPSLWTEEVFSSGQEVSYSAFQGERHGTVRCTTMSLHHRIDGLILFQSVAFGDWYVKFEDGRGTMLNSRQQVVMAADAARTRATACYPIEK